MICSYRLQVYYSARCGHRRRLQDTVAYTHPWCHLLRYRTERCVHMDVWNIRLYVCLCSTDTYVYIYVCMIIFTYVWVGVCV